MGLLKKRIFRKRTLLSFLAGLIILYFLITKLDLAEVLNIITQINLWWFVAALFIAFLAFPVIALRWKILLKNAGLKTKSKDLTEIIFLFYFVNFILPAKLGEFYRGYLIKKNYKFPLSKTIGTIFVERLMDLFFLLMFLVILIFTLFRGFFPVMIRLPLEIGTVLLVGLIISSFLMKYQRERVIKLLPKKLKLIFHNFERGVSTCLRWNDLPLLGFYSLLRWLIAIVTTYLVVLSINLKLSFFLIIFIVLASALVSLIPITPAGLGVGEVTIAGILILFGIEQNLAISASILIRVLAYWYVLLLTGFVYIISSKK